MASKQTKQAKWNLNDFILVRLTKRGRLVYRARYGSLPSVDKDGYTEFQLWDFANIFGQYMTIGYGDDLVCEPDFIIKSWIS